MSFFDDLGAGLKDFGREVLKIGTDVAVNVGSVWLNEKINPRPKQNSGPASQPERRQEQTRANPGSVGATQRDAALTPVMAGFGGKNMLIVAGLAGALLLMRK